MRVKRNYGRLYNSDTMLLQMLFLSLCFLLGIIAGQVLAGRYSKSYYIDISAYLSDYLLLSGSNERSMQLLLATAQLYFRDVFFVFLLGLSAIGAIMIPLYTLMVSAFLSYSVSCFIAVFGSRGAFLAFALFGFRALIIIPCYFFLSVPAWKFSLGFMATFSGKKSRSGHLIPERRYWLCLATIFGVLFLACFLEFWFAPALLPDLIQQTIL